MTAERGMQKKTELQSTTESIQHWQRMRAWVARQPQGERPVAQHMIRAIGETWYRDDCALCMIKPGADCYPACPMSRAMYADERSYSCCCAPRAPWLAVHEAETWADWLEAADRLIADLHVTMALLKRGKI
jgi:hypothetical protein